MSTSDPTVNSFVAGNTVDILLQLKNVRTGLPTSASAVTVTITLIDPSGATQVSNQPMAPAVNTPPGYWLYTYNTPTTPLGTWQAFYRVTDLASNLFVSTTEPVFTTTAS